VSERIQKSDSTYLGKIENWINYRYDDILSRKDWPQLYRQTDMTATAGSETMILNRDVELITAIQDRTNDIVLVPMDPSIGARFFVDIQDTNGTPRNYWWEGSTVAAQPTSASVIAVASNSASDTSQTVRIWGISGGNEVNEQISLNGTTGVNSTNSYTRVDRVSKSATTSGTITGTSNAAAVTVFTMDPSSRTARHIKIHLLRRPQSNTTYTVVYKIRTPKLEFADDVPMIDCSQALVIGAYCDALRQQRQHSKAKVLEFNPNMPSDVSTYEGRVLQILQKFEQQAENIPLMTPQIQRDPIDQVDTFFAFPRRK